MRISIAHLRPRISLKNSILYPFGLIYKHVESDEYPEQSTQGTMVFDGSEFGEFRRNRSGWSWISKFVPIVHKVAMPLYIAIRDLYLDLDVIVDIDKNVIAPVEWHSEYTLPHTVPRNREC